MAMLDGLIGCWSPSLGASGYTLLDRSKKSQHASFQNFSSQPFRASPKGVAASFASASTNRALCGVPVLSGTGDFTIAAWVNPLSVSGTVNEFYIAGNYGASNLTGVEINGYNGKFGCYCSSGATFFSTVTFTAGVWTHVCATRVGGTVSLYLNGVFDSSATRAGSIGTSRNWCIGNGPDYTAGWGGSVTEVAAWSRGITAGEVRELFRLDSGWIGRELTGVNKRRRVVKGPSLRRKSLLLMGVGS